MKPSVTVLLLSLVLFSQNLAAVPNQRIVSVKVTVADPNGAVIQRGLVVFKSATFKGRRHTGEEGSFVIELPSGEYEIEVEAFGFKRIKKLEVITDTQRELEFQLYPQESTPHHIFYEPLPIEIKRASLQEKIKPQKIQ